MDKFEQFLEQERPRMSLQTREKLDAKMIQKERSKVNRFNLQLIGGLCALALALVVAIPMMKDGIESSPENGTMQADNSIAPSVEAPSGAEGAGKDTIDELSVRKQVQKGEVDVVVEQVGNTLLQLTAAVSAQGGYVVNSNMVETNIDGGGAQMTIQVPKENYAALMKEISKSGEIASVSQSAVDVTDQYSDLEAQIAENRALQLAIISQLAKTDSESALRLQLRELRAESKNLRAQAAKLDAEVQMPQIVVNLTANAKEQTDLEIAFNQATSTLADVFAYIVYLGILISPVILLALVFAALLRYRRRRNSKQ